MDLGAGFDAAAHDYDGLLREPASVENMTNGGPGVQHQQAAASPAQQYQSQQQQQQLQQDALASSPPTDDLAAEAVQQQQQPMNEPGSVPAETSPPTMADPPRGPTFIGSSGVSEVKLKRFLEHNQRLREHLEMPRIPVSEASNSLIHFVTTTRDALLPSLWGTTGADPFAKQSTGCCTIS
ncbi:hypothetical protein BGX23_010365 [Mortierella sp. AD031]|nr:hypothetical protein BGX23_010365 [Mortierella sp. AD031]